MEDVVTAGGTDQLPLIIYLDDVIIFGDDMDQLLQHAETAMKRLAAAGFMLNLRKSHIGVSQAKVLGHEWSSGGYFEPAKAKLQ